MPSESSKTINAFDLSAFKRNYVLYLIALLQGLVLLAIYEALDYKVWPYGNTLAITILLSIFIPIPIFALLTASRENWRQVLRYLLWVSVIFCVIAAYTGYQMGPNGMVRTGLISSIYITTLFLLSFKIVMYMQQYVGFKKISYSALFKYSWRNSLSIVFASVFTSVFWGILMLWAGLFKILEIDLFYDLFTDEWFCIPVSVCAFGIAITIARDLKQLLDNSSRILQALIKFLLPMLVIVLVIFLIAIPFRGLSLLWKTGMGTTLILWLQALTLFFANAVFRDEADVRPYPLLLHRMIYVGIALLPTYSAIAFYSLYLRIDQYGLTVSRCWAFVVWFFLACFAAAYLYGIIKQRDQWVATLGKINVAMGLVLIATMILVNSPILDFRKISATSQFDRLQQGKVNIDNFDLRYVKNELGRAGYEKIQILKENIRDSNPKAFTTLDNLYLDKTLPPTMKYAKTLSKDEFSKRIIVWPKDTVLPEDIINSAYKQVITRSRWRNDADNYFLIAIDLNRDNIKERLLFINDGYQSAWLYQGANNGNDEWRDMTIYGGSSNLIKNAVENNDIKSVEPEWMELDIGGAKIRTSKLR